jgi:hypothetical protein
MNLQKLLIYICAGLIFPIYLSGQITFERIYGGALDDEGYSVQQTLDGGYIISGYTESFGPGQRSVYLIKTDALGDTLWTKTYGGPYYDYGYFVQQTPDNGYIIVGATQYVQGGQFDVYLIKTDADGNMLWSRTYDGPDPGHNDAGEFLQPTSDGGYIISGGTERLDGYYDYYLIKTDGNGDIIWTKTYGAADVSETGREVQITSDGGYIVVGDSMGLTNHQVYLVKTDSLGNLLWTRSYGGSGFDWGHSVKETPDGGYIIAGTFNMYDAWLIKTDPLGDTLWTRRYGSSGYPMDCARSVQLTADGGYILAGWTNSFGAGSFDIYLVETAPWGDTLWTRTYGGTSSDLGQWLQPTSDGGYIIVGYTESFGAGGRDVYLIKTDSSGNVVGIEENARHSTPDALRSLQIYPNPSNGVVRIACSVGRSAKDEELKIYDATGKLVKQFTQLLNDQLPNNQVVWSGDDNAGRSVPTGVYFIHIKSNDYQKVEKVILLR